MLRRLAAGLVWITLAPWTARPAAAGANDLVLMNLCAPAPVARAGGARGVECAWVKRQPGTGVIERIELDADAESRFRSLMSELGLVMAPRLMVPAQTLGLAGFQLSAEIGSTSISERESFWNGVERVSPQAPTMRRPAGALTTVGVYARKGLWIPLPGFEVGGGVMHLVDSHLLSWQGYAKLALHEGFHDWPLPSLAVRGSAAYVTGSDEIRMSIIGVDVVLSRGWTLLETARFEPYAGWSFLWVNARANPMDATPDCDAWVARTAPPTQALGEGCAPAQRGTDNDALATFALPPQDAIPRQRLVAGAKLRFSTLFVAAQYEMAPPGRSRDRRSASGARDGSGKQEGLSLSAGFDF